MTIKSEHGNRSAAFVERSETFAAERLDKWATNARGIYTAHSTFGGSAGWGVALGIYANQDGNGHRTYTAGTGTTYSMAIPVNILAVKCKGYHVSRAVAN
ncbi:hypothetical protein FRC08_005168 [Ceratobasidium sp. 394]|nr:hypothetical protein FRC08_005168 [Ceratobasidium sp. 394]